MTRRTETFRQPEHKTIGEILCQIIRGWGQAEHSKKVNKEGTALKTVHVTADIRGCSHSADWTDGYY